jgi:hypothetical protein
MEQVKCPGQDTRFWKAEDIFTVECPKCGAEIEFFKDDTRRRCAWCGHLFYNPKIELGCAEYCQYADKCVPELMAERRAMATFRERLKERVSARLGSEAAPRLEQALGLAADLLKAEGGDPKVVFAAVLLAEVLTEEAAGLLTELGTEPEIAAQILAVLTGAAPAADLNRRLFEEVRALLTGAPPEALVTTTGRKLAAWG